MQQNNQQSNNANQNKILIFNARIKNIINISSNNNDNVDKHSNTTNAANKKITNEVLEELNEEAQDL